jgi:hypothetical protein
MILMRDTCRIDFVAYSKNSIGKRYEIERIDRIKIGYKKSILNEQTV